MAQMAGEINSDFYGNISSSNSSKNNSDYNNNNNNYNNWCSKQPLKIFKRKDSLIFVKRMKRKERKKRKKEMTLVYVRQEMDEVLSVNFKDSEFAGEWQEYWLLNHLTRDWLLNL